MFCAYNVAQTRDIFYLKLAQSEKKSILLLTQTFITLDAVLIEFIYGVRYVTQKLKEHLSDAINTFVTTSTQNLVKTVKTKKKDLKKMKLKVVSKSL